jgi:hypothetical protein
LKAEAAALLEKALAAEQRLRAAEARLLKRRRSGVKETLSSTGFMMNWLKGKNPMDRSTPRAAGEGGISKMAAEKDLIKERALRGVVNLAVQHIENSSSTLLQEIQIMDGLILRYFGKMGKHGLRTDSDILNEMLITSMVQFVHDESNHYARVGTKRGRYRSGTRRNIYTVVRSLLSADVTQDRLSKLLGLSRATIKRIDSAPIGSDGMFQVPPPNYDQLRKIGEDQSAFARQFWEFGAGAGKDDRFIRPSECKRYYAKNPADPKTTHVVIWLYTAVGEFYDHYTATCEEKLQDALDRHEAGIADETEVGCDTPMTQHTLYHCYGCTDRFTTLRSCKSHQKQSCCGSATPPEQLQTSTVTTRAGEKPQFRYLCNGDCGKHFDTLSGFRRHADKSECDNPSYEKTLFFADHDGAKREQICKTWAPVSRTEFVNQRPYFVKASRMEDCLCKYCLQLDLLLQTWRADRSRSPCKCDRVPTKFELRDMLLCAKGRGEELHNYRCVLGDCEDCQASACGAPNRVVHIDDCTNADASPNKLVICKCHDVDAGTIKTPVFEKRQWNGQTREDFYDKELARGEFFKLLWEKATKWLVHYDVNEHQSMQFEYLQKHLPFHSVKDQQDFAEAFSFSPAFEHQSRHWIGGQRLLILPIVLDADVRCFKNLTQKFKDDLIKKRGVDPSKPCLFRETIYFVSDVLAQDVELVIHVNEFMQEYIAKNLDASPTCDCDERCRVDNHPCGCDGPENPTCKRAHYTTSDGCSSQYKNRWIAIWVGQQNSKGSLRRVWLFECSAHGKGPCDPEGGCLKHMTDSMNTAFSFGEILHCSNAETVKANVEPKLRLAPENLLRGSNLSEKRIGRRQIVVVKEGDVKRVPRDGDDIEISDNFQITKFHQVSDVGDMCSTGKTTVSCRRLACVSCDACLNGAFQACEKGRGRPGPAHVCTLTDNGRLALRDRAIKMALRRDPGAELAVSMLKGALPICTPARRANQPFDLVKVTCGVVPLRQPQVLALSGISGPSETGALYFQGVFLNEDSDFPGMYRTGGGKVKIAARAAKYLPSIQAVGGGNTCYSLAQNTLAFLEECYGGGAGIDTHVGCISIPHAVEFGYVSASEKSTLDSILRALELSTASTTTATLDTDTSTSTSTSSKLSIGYVERSGSCVVTSMCAALLSDLSPTAASFTDATTSATGTGASDSEAGATATETSILNSSTRTSATETSTSATGTLASVTSTSKSATTPVILAEGTRARGKLSVEIGTCQRTGEPFSIMQYTDDAYFLRRAAASQLSKLSINEKLNIFESLKTLYATKKENAPKDSDHGSVDLDDVHDLLKLYKSDLENRKEHIGEVGLWMLAKALRRSYRVCEWVDGNLVQMCITPEEGIVHLVGEGEHDDDTFVIAKVSSHYYPVVLVAASTSVGDDHDDAQPPADGTHSLNDEEPGGGSSKYIARAKPLAPLAPGGTFADAMRGAALRGLAAATELANDGHCDYAITDVDVVDHLVSVRKTPSGNRRWETAWRGYPDKEHNTSQLEVTKKHHGVREWMDKRSDVAWSTLVTKFLTTTLGKACMITKADLLRRPQVQGIPPPNGSEYCKQHRSPQVGDRISFYDGPVKAGWAEGDVTRSTGQLVSVDYGDDGVFNHGRSSPLSQAGYGKTWVRLHSSAPATSQAQFQPVAQGLAVWRRFDLGGWCLGEVDLAMGGTVRVQYLAGFVDHDPTEFTEGHYGTTWIVASAEDAARARDALSEPPTQEEKGRGKRRKTKSKKAEAAVAASGGKVTRPKPKGQRQRHKRTAAMALDHSAAAAKKHKGGAITWGDCVCGVAGTNGTNGECSECNAGPHIRRGDEELNLCNCICPHDGDEPGCLTTCTKADNWSTVTSNHIDWFDKQWAATAAIKMDRHSCRLTPALLACFRRATYINDESIDTYIALVMDRVQAESKQCLAVGTELYRSGLLAATPDRAARMIVRALKRAGKGKITINTIETIVMPCNIRGNHWAVLELDVQSGTVTWHDSAIPRPFKQKKSLRSLVFQAAQALLKAVRGVEELTEAKFTCPRDDEGKADTFDWAINNGGPRQANGYDCGVHALLHVRNIATGEDNSHEAAWETRSQMVVELLRGKLCTGAGAELVVPTP